MSLAKTLLTAFVALSPAATALAQIRPAAITGAVKDRSAAAAANAEVVITNSGTNISYKTKSTEAGLYRMSYLEAGTYTATVARCVSFREMGLAIATNQTARVDVNLKAGTAGGSETPATVEVAARAAQTQAGSSAATNDTTNAADAQVINDIPDVTRNPLFYAMLQSGVQPRNETSTSTLGDL
jgi:trimeric autotransporter adhesin